ncbi:MAG: tRNA (adenosine(37)-N6)-threonylcarbamoyltransferase complex ATPase subunit type 1 TsaE [Clostridiales bacterium]|nr:tRNA (adenosine(37)-N6)-threonylcarbamoyltransferase complex ATPase subunit type 1 TsaE [Clostridiales bacterium]
MNLKNIVCTTEHETEDLGKRLVRALPVPSFVALYGDLGAGKTALVRGMGAETGTAEVRSPTFTIVHEYDSKPKLIHFDAYRLHDAEELFAIGFEDYLVQDAVVVLEWAERVPEALPRERLEIRLCGSGEEPRALELWAIGARYESVVNAL